MQWFRLYTDITDNHKLRMLAFEDRWHFVAILACNSAGLIKGENDFLERALAVKLGVQLRELDEIKRRLIDVKLIDLDWKPVGWDERQYVSDSSAARTRKYREKRKQNNLGAGQGGYEKHRSALMQRDDSKCVYCGSVDNLCIDHMIPVAQGGSDHIDNLAISCKSCNSGKSGRSPEQAGFKIASKQALEALSRYVTVTVTPPDTDTDTDTDTEQKQKKQTVNWKDVQRRVAALGVDWSLFREFLTTRQTLKARNTPYGLKVLLNKIEDLVSAGENATTMIEESNSNGWKTVYPAKRDRAKTKSAVELATDKNW